MLIVCKKQVIEIKIAKLQSHCVELLKAFGASNSESINPVLRCIGRKSAKSIFPLRQNNIRHHSGKPPL